MTTNPLCVTRTQRLIHKLDLGLAHHLTLLIAPEGSGKSRLLSFWAERTGIETVTLHLNHQDIAPEAIIQKICQCCPEEVRAEESEMSPETRIINLINRLCEIPHDLAVVLDGYRPSPESDALLGLLIDYLPPPVHVYIACEQAPDLPSLPRMRVRRQLLELTSRDFELETNANQQLHHSGNDSSPN